MVVCKSLIKVNFFTAQVSPALGSSRISPFVGRSVGHDPTLHWITYIQAYTTPLQKVSKM